MVSNKIIRRYGILRDALYEQLAADMIELFDGFSGVTYESVTVEEEEEKYTDIYFDANKRMYIRITYDANFGARINLYLGSSAASSREYINIDGNTSGSKAAYSFVKTPYGAAFSTIMHSESDLYIVQDGYIRNFFSVFEDESGNKYNGLVYVSQSNDEVNQTTYTVATPIHTYLETINPSSFFMGSSANHNVLCNAFSYLNPIVAPRLYKKLQTEGMVFGKIKIAGKMLISGSHFALECANE